MNEYRKVFTFPNGYGASVVSHQYTYGGKEGLFEVAVLDRHGDLTYTTPITSDVLGFLSFAEVGETLEAISQLEKE